MSKARTKRNPRKAPQPFVLNINPDQIVDLHYANEDRVNEDLAAIFANPMMSAMMGGPGFAGEMVAFSVYKAAEHVLRIEDAARLYPHVPTNDVERAKLQYRKALVSARKTLGPSFDAIYEACRVENNECARLNLDQSNGTMYCYVVPKFNDDGTHESPGPRDFPWNQPVP